MSDCRLWLNMWMFDILLFLINKMVFFVLGKYFVFCSKLSV